MKIPIKKYVMDESLSWEERYRQLEAHHTEETTLLINRIKELETSIDSYNNLQTRIANLKGSRT